MTKRYAQIGLFSAIAIIFGYIESLLPFFAGIPGIKLGLANLSILFLLIRFSWKEAAIVSIIRITVVGFMFGNLFGILYSLAGAFLSLLVMVFLLKKTDASVYAVSMAGGIAHNIGQLLIAALIVENKTLLLYAPVLIVSGILAGFFIGFLTVETLKRVPHVRD